MLGMTMHIFKNWAIPLVGKAFALETLQFLFGLLTIFLKQIRADEIDYHFITHSLGNMCRLLTSVCKTLIKIEALFLKLCTDLGI